MISRLNTELERNMRTLTLFLGPLILPKTLVPRLTRSMGIGKTLWRPWTARSYPLLLRPREVPGKPQWFRKTWRNSRRKMRPFGWYEVGFSKDTNLQEKN